MKYMNYKFLLAVSMVLVLVSCKKFTDIENIELQLPKVGTEAYYENLKAYKKSDHAVAFGWFGGWSAQGPDKSRYLASLPDSVDIVSLWVSDTYFNLTPEKIKDLEFVQKVKGTKVLICMGSQFIGDALEKWDTTGGVRKRTIFVKQDSADVVKYANALLDTIHKYNYDGIDIDHEPSYGHNGPLADNRKFMEIFINTLATKLGPKSGTGKLLCVDGEPYLLPAYQGELLSYFIAQAYYETSPTAYDRRIDRVRDLEGFSTKKFIVTEDFERYTPTSATPGGQRQSVTAFRVPINPIDYVDPNASVKRVPSLIGMAYWNPVDGRKGGVGTYHMEYEYTDNPDYKYLRRAIQIMNPAPY